MSTGHAIIELDLPAIEEVPSVHSSQQQVLSLRVIERPAPPSSVRLASIARLSYDNA